MKRNWIPILFLSLFVTPAYSQTLFTYGGQEADARVFLKAFNKNNSQPDANRGRAIKEYLNLYINSRLKIREAYERKLDTLPSLSGELENLRSQIIENYMTDPQALNRLTREAFQRSLKDIRVAHIFVSFVNDKGEIDSLAAKAKLDEIKRRLGKGEDFMEVARQYSDDPSAKVNRGSLNYITVFTLPYDFENIVYSTPVGSFSKPYLSATGYHIFKNLGERKAIGRIKIQQILLAFPPGLNEEGKKETGRLADSLYRLISAGADLSQLAARYSNDYVSAASEGNIPDISVGQYDPLFEEAILALKDGVVSKPFQTSHGYHIVKRISVKPVIANSSDKENMDQLQQKVMADDRWKTTRSFIYDRVRSKAGFIKSEYDERQLWAITDSLLDGVSTGQGISLTSTSPLFRIGDSTFYVRDWIGFAQMNRYQPSRKSLKSYPALMEDFSKESMVQYYRAHLEDFNEEFKSQMDEFKDGNLFFEIMQQEVWNKAQADSAALLSIYEMNKSRYDWKQSADAVIFFCTDEPSAKSLVSQIIKNPGNWRSAVESMSDKVVADSSRYEWSQIPGLTGSPQEGILTPVTVNPADKTASLAFVFKVYKQPSPRSFQEAKGLVMNDYQARLEQEWISELKEKYPVVINQKVLASIMK